MTTVIWATGFEYGLTTLSTNGGGIADTIAGSVITTTGSGIAHNNQGHALSITVPSGGASTYILRNLTSTSYLVGSIYLMIPTGYQLDAGGSARLRFSIGGTATYLYLSSDALNYYWYQSGYTGSDSSVTIVENTWHRIDFRINGPAKTIDWYMDGIAQTQYVHGISGAITDIRLQNQVGGVTHWAYFDDVVLSNTPEDFPIGEHFIVGSRPFEDGTHNAGTNIMEDNAGNDIGTVSAYPLIYEDPWSATPSTYIRQNATGSGRYAEIQFTDYDYNNPIGAVALLQYRSSATTANEGATIITNEDGTETAVWGSRTSKADYSESSSFYKYAVLPTPAGGWDTNAVNALKSKMGFSNNVASIPYWTNLLTEIIYSGSPTQEEPISGIKAIAGAEYGLPTISTSGTGLFDGAGGVAVQTSSTYTTNVYSNYSYKFSATSNTCWVNFQSATIGSPTVEVGSAYVLFTGWPSTNLEIVGASNVYGTNNYVYLESSTKKIGMSCAGTTATANVVLASGFWYRIDWKIDVSANPWTMDLQVNGVAATQTTASIAATTHTTAWLGWINNDTATMYLDDYVLSTNADDYPIGGHVVFGSTPTDSASYGNPGTNIIEDNVGGDIGASNRANGYVASIPWSDSDTSYVVQSATGSGNFGEFAFDTQFTNGTPQTILGARVLLMYASDGVTANTGGFYVVDEDGTKTTVWGTPGALADYSETAKHYKSVMLPTPNNGWDEAALDALKGRIGFSDNVASKPRWYAVLAEVAIADIYYGGIDWAKHAYTNGQAAGNTKTGSKSAYIKGQKTARTWSFPKGPILDDFNRGSLGSDWTVHSGTPTMDGSVVGTSTTGTTVILWKDTKGPAVDAFITIKNLPVTNEADAYIDYDDNGSTNYRLYTSNLTQTSINIHAYKYTTSWISIISTGTLTYSTRTSVKIGIRHNPNGDIYIYLDRGNGWEMVASGNDLQVFSTGETNLRWYRSGAVPQHTYDDWGIVTLSDSYVNNGATAYTKGSSSSSDNQYAYVRGSSTTRASKSAYLKGATGIVANKAAYTKGKSTIVANKAAYTRGKTSIIANKAAFTKGGVKVVANKAAYTRGGTKVVANKAAYTRGGIVVVANKAAYTRGRTSTVANKFAYTRGKSISIANKAAYTKGSISSNASKSAFTQGSYRFEIEWIKLALPPSEVLSTAASKAAYTKGYTTAVANKSAYTTGGIKVLANKSAYTKGSLTFVANKSAYTKGSSSFIANKAAYTKGKDTKVANKSAYTSGGIKTSANKAAYIQGKSTTSAVKSAYTRGSSNILANKAAYTKGSSIYVSNKSAYTSGGIKVLANKFAYTKGSSSPRYNIPAFTEGKSAVQVANKPAFTQGKLSITANKAAFTKGGIKQVANKAAFTQGKLTQVANKYVYTRGSATNTASKYAYTRGIVGASASKFAYTSGKSTYSAIKSAFVQGKNTSVANKFAYTRGNASQLASKATYIAGKSAYSVTKSAYTRGKLSTSANKFAYTKGKADSISNKWAYTRGSSVATSNKWVYTKGKSDYVDNQPAFVSGKSTHSSTKSAYICGGIISSDNQSAYITGKINITDVKHAFIEGFAPGIASQKAYTRGLDSSAYSHSAFVQGSYEFEIEWVQVGLPPTQISLVTANKPAYIVGKSSFISNRYAYTSGKSITSDNQPAYIVGKSTYQSNRFAFTQGKSIYVANKAAYTSGKFGSVANKVAFTQGKSTYSSVKSVYTRGSLSTVYNKFAYTFGKSTHQSSKSAYIFGKSTFIVNKSAFTKGKDTLVGNKYAFTKGKDTKVTSKWAFTVGGIKISGNKIAYLRGASQLVANKPAYTNGLSEGNVASKSAYTRGSSSFVANKSAYLRGASSYQANRYAYTKGKNTYTASKPAYIVGKTSVVYSRYAYTKGSSPFTSSRYAYTRGGVVTSDNQPAFIASRATYSGYVHAFIEGFAANTTSKWAYTKGKSSYVSNKAAFTRGGLRAAKSAYTKGSVVSSDSRHAYIAGQSSKNSQKFAYISGKNLVNYQKSAYIRGKSTYQALTKAYLCGKIVISGNKAAFTKGRDVASASKAAYISGKSTTNVTSVHAYTLGGVVARDSQSAFIAVIAVVDTYRHAYLIGFLANVANKSAFTYGAELVRSSRHAYLSGTVPTVVHIIECKVVINSGISEKIVINTTLAANVNVNTQIKTRAAINTMIGYAVIINSVVNRNVKI